MIYKYLVVFLFCIISAQSWCQHTVYVAPEQIRIQSQVKLIPSGLPGSDLTKYSYTIDYFQYCTGDKFQNGDTGYQNIKYNCDTIRNGIVEKANEYIGVRYRYGQSSEKGFDCSGFVKYIYRSFGFTLPHSSYAQYRMSKHLKAPDVKPGDLVFFITRGKNISHVGIYLGANRFIHAPGKGGFVSIDSMGYYYKRHFVGFGSVL